VAQGRAVRASQERVRARRDGRALG
jgi:hypothetical protein